MTAATNNAIRLAVAQQTNAQNDNIAASNAASQATAARVNGEIFRVVTSVATGSIILPSIGTGEASVISYVINDSPNAINLYPALGETINALAANATISIPTLQTAICIPQGGPSQIGGPPTASINNWRVVITT